MESIDHPDETTGLLAESAEPLRSSSSQSLSQQVLARDISVIPVLKEIFVRSICRGHPKLGGKTLRT